MFIHNQQRNMKHNLPAPPNNPPAAGAGVEAAGVVADEEPNSPDAAGTGVDDEGPNPPPAEEDPNPTEVDVPNPPDAGGC